VVRKKWAQKKASRARILTGYPCTGSGKGFSRKKGIKQRSLEKGKKKHQRVGGRGKAWEVGEVPQKN